TSTRRPGRCLPTTWKAAPRCCSARRSGGRNTSRSWPSPPSPSPLPRGRGEGEGAAPRLMIRNPYVSHALSHDPLKGVRVARGEICGMRRRVCLCRECPPAGSRVLVLHEDSRMPDDVVLPFCPLQIGNLPPRRPSDGPVKGVVDVAATVVTK